VAVVRKRTIPTELVVSTYFINLSICDEIYFNANKSRSAATGWEIVILEIFQISAQLMSG
jgi:hypothetical protein